MSDITETLVVIDFFEMMSHLDKIGEWNQESLHDDMFEMADPYEQFRNDTYWHVSRHWIKNKKLQPLFDLIREEAGIPQEFSKNFQTDPMDYYTNMLKYGNSKYEWGAEENTTLVFWVSW